MVDKENRMMCQKDRTRCNGPELCFVFFLFGGDGYMQEHICEQDPVYRIENACCHTFCASLTAGFDINQWGSDKVAMDVDTYTWSCNWNCTFQSSFRRTITIVACLMVI